MCNTNCSSHCVTCKQTSDQCFECVNGKHGDVCDLDCSDNCEDKSCMKDNGYCLECVPGKHGNECASDCSDNCKDKTCMKNNGNCTGCITGKAGALCDTNCSSYCETCDQTSEQCFECVNGKYGDVCDQGCPNDCKDQSCMKDNGYCSDCPVGKYGLLCNNSCSETCLNNICNARSGTCEVKETTSLEPQPGNTGVIVGVVVAGLLLVITITITLFLIRRRKQNSAKQDSFDDISRKNVSRTSHYNDGYEPEDYSTEPVTEQGNVYEVLDVAETESLTGQRNVYTNASNVEIVGNDIETLTNNVYVNANDVDKDSSRKVCKEAGPASTCIAISDLKALVKTKRINNAKAFEDEYQELPSKAIHEHNIGKLDEHRLKNRFKSTFPYDHSRVILDKLDNDSHSDYINANYIDSVISPAEYIATQGPTDITVDDLWRMIWQLKSRKIVMLTNLIEGTRKKCAKYWPDEGEPMSTKHFEIVLDRERIYAFYVIRDIILTEKKTKSVRQIHQFHYTTWPDHGTPDPNELVVFHRRVKHYNNILTGKLIVHCSAGIGRTGTFIALDALFEYGKENGVVDVMEFVRTMRKDRVNMVQTSDQYIAIHNLLIEAFDMPDTLVPRMKYHTTLKCLCDDAPVNQTKLWREYKLIQDIKPTYTENDYKTATIPANRNKNRDPNILAVDKFRAYLSSSSFGRTDYINAVEIPSYKSRTGYIVTQTPLKDTVVDLLTLIMDRDCDTLVIIENDQMKWLPEEGNDKSIGSFKLRHGGGSSSLTNTDLIDVSISNQEQRYDARIRVFQITGWDRHVSVPPDSPGLLQLLELLDSRRRSNDSKKTVVMCRDGNSQSGLFCCISNARDQMKIDEEVDIFQIARQLLFRRPEFITNYDQYKCCYHMIKEYLDTTDMAHDRPSPVHHKCKAKLSKLTLMLIFI
ncbi:Receptor-type tyrosine-protein phosphatase T [Mizuhopecten yessoensis]|uniref:protein-tyrosine-phosphatase n=1 Tax=Mizuhopecten yessoensis TaxID=6573 RepID=A0A210Q575_MIZYE|nr:Receptor-type tyrosine-protein phosphatase T [Mizuhopecten yessoensis]